MKTKIYATIALNEILKQKGVYDYERIKIDKIKRNIYLKNSIVNHLIVYREQLLNEASLTCRIL